MPNSHFALTKWLFFCYIIRSNGGLRRLRHGDSMSEKKFDPSTQLSERNLAWAVRLHAEIGNKKTVTLYLRDNHMSVACRISEVNTNGMVTFVVDRTTPSKTYEAHVSDVIMITY